MRGRTGIKRLFFDIETSKNIVETWNIGWDIQINHDDIIEERAVICLCYKWEGSDKVYSLKWNNGDDTKLIHDFFDVMCEADEVVGHNGDNYDIKWFRTRAIIHGVKSMPEIKSIDTLKIARNKFRFNSNKLDYIAGILGLGHKIKTDNSLWKKVRLGDKQALIDMITYCKKDVVLLEQVYNKLKGFDKPKTHVGVLNGGDKCSCPSCGSDNTVSNGNIISVSGTAKKKMLCNNCGIYYNIPYTTYKKCREEEK